MNGKRTSLEVIAEILDQCYEPSIKTRIMYGSNLSYPAVTKYLDWLKSVGLLKETQTTGRYKTTPRGDEFLVSWSRICKMLKTEKSADPFSVCESHKKRM